jgi:hypothetical protein
MPDPREMLAGDIGVYEQMGPFARSAAVSAAADLREAAEAEAAAAEREYRAQAYAAQQAAVERSQIAARGWSDAQLRQIQRQHRAISDQRRDELAAEQWHRNGQAQYEQACARRQESIAAAEFDLSAAVSAHAESSVIDRLRRKVLLARDAPLDSPASRYAGPDFGGTLSRVRRESADGYMRREVERFDRRRRGSDIARQHARAVTEELRGWWGEEPDYVWRGDQPAGPIRRVTETEFTVY